MSASAVANDRELVVTRMLDAPPEVVFEAWTNPKHLVNWYGPFGFTTTIHEMDVRPGGVWRLVMHGPDGRDYHNRIIFEKVIRPQLLVYRHEPEPGSEPSNHQTTVTFEPEGQRTRLTLRMVFESAAQREYVIRTYKADEGGQQTLQRLADHLLSRAKQDVVLTRILNAPRDLVWKVWTDPKHILNWWGPHGMKNQIGEWNLIIGGHIQIEMHADDGAVHPMEGVFEEIIEPERLSFRASIPGPDGTVKVMIRNTATLVEQSPGKTLLTLEAHIISTTEDGLINLAGMEMGWTQSLERFAAEVDSLCK